MGKSADPRAMEREALWRMALQWRQEGLIRVALGAYWKILDRYPESEEAQKAKDEILGLAKRLETEGRFRQAMALYEQLAGRA